VKHAAGQIRALCGMVHWEIVSDAPTLDFLRDGVEVLSPNSDNDIAAATELVSFLRAQNWGAHHRIAMGASEQLPSEHPQDLGWT
jgi:hypothetical protein